MSEPTSPEPSSAPEQCHFIQVMEVVGGKWRGTIIYCLSKGSVRFGELRREIGPITQKMLTQELRSLERDGLVARVQYPEIPPRVVYSLTEFGKSTLPIFQQIETWSSNLSAVETARLSYDQRQSG